MERGTAFPTLLSAKQWLRSAFALISEISKLSLNERQSFCLDYLYTQADLSLRWAHMQSYRKCCASAEISDILLAGFVFIKSLPTPLSRCYTNDILGPCMDYNERSTSMKHQLLNNVFSALLLSWTGGYVVTAPKKLTFIFTWLRFYLTLYCKIRWLYLCWKLQCEFQRQGPDCAGWSWRLIFAYRLLTSTPCLNPWPGLLKQIQTVRICITKGGVLTTCYNFNNKEFYATKINLNCRKNCMRSFIHNM